jgi:hypothetical protein
MVRIDATHAPHTNVTVSAYENSSSWQGAGGIDMNHRLDDRE